MVSLFWMFYLYAFIGFLLETLFAIIMRGRFENRKTNALLPVCPVYGVGALAIGLAAAPFRQTPLLVFCIGAVVGTVAEYGYSFLFDRIFHVLVWDYGHTRGSIHGRVNLYFSVIWGLLSVMMVDKLQPVVETLAAAIPGEAFSPAFLAALLDGAVTFWMLRRFGHGQGPALGCPVLRRSASARRPRLHIILDEFLGEPPAHMPRRASLPRRFVTLRGPR